MTVRQIARADIQPGDTVRVWMDEFPERESDPVSEYRVFEFTVTRIDGEVLYYGPGRGEYVHTEHASWIELLDRPDIRVGDRVRREPPIRGGVTIEFTVNRIHEGRIYPAYGVNDALVGYEPERFKVLARAE